MQTGMIIKLAVPLCNYAVGTDGTAFIALNGNLYQHASSRSEAAIFDWIVI